MLRRPVKICNPKYSSFMKQGWADALQPNQGLALSFYPETLVSQSGTPDARSSDACFFFFLFLFSCPSEHDVIY
jgi:hypothetical protein